MNWYVCWLPMLIFCAFFLVYFLIQGESRPMTKCACEGQRIYISIFNCISRSQQLWDSRKTLVSPAVFLRYPLRLFVSSFTIASSTGFRRAIFMFVKPCPACSANASRKLFFFPHYSFGFCGVCEEWIGVLCKHAVSKLG